MMILIPKTRYELEDMIYDEISAHGNTCSLNHIDVSFIKDMSQLFHYFKQFNGDISQWNVSHVINMQEMFLRSQFNGDISQWDVSSVIDMKHLFKESFFNGNINDWTPFRLVHPHMTSMLSSLMDKPTWFSLQKKDLEVTYFAQQLAKKLPVNLSTQKHKL